MTPSPEDERDDDGNWTSDGGQFQPTDNRTTRNRSEREQQPRGGDPAGPDSRQPRTGQRGARQQRRPEAHGTGAQRPREEPRRDEPGGPTGGEKQRQETANQGLTSDWAAEEHAADAPPSEQSAGASGQETTYTARFVGFIALFGVLVAAGLVTFHPAAFAAAGLLLVFLLAGLLQTPTAPADHLTTSYEVTPTHPRPADTVTVTITVENDSEKTFTDVRLVDTVPEELQVVARAPRGGGPLRPGESLTIEYDVVARRGTHTFGPVVARTRTLAGSMWSQQPLPTATDGEIECAVRADDIPLEERASNYLGSLLSDTGGEGIEFYATREYHHGDPPSKIHWRDLAKRGELSTITYRERQAASVTIVTDARPCARVSAGPGEPSGAMLSGYATYQLLTSLVDRGHYVGVVVPGLEPRHGNGQFPYRRIDHGRGDSQQRLALDLLDDIDQSVGEVASHRTTTAMRNYSRPSFRRGRDATDRLDTTSLVSIGDFARDLSGWSTPDTQFICVTPLVDDAMQGLVRRLRGEDFPVIVISPDVTAEFTSTTTESTTARVDGQQTDNSDVTDRTLQLQRATRIESLRQQGVTVIDWDPAKPLSVCCENQTEPGA